MLYSWILDHKQLYVVKKLDFGSQTALSFNKKWVGNGRLKGGLRLINVTNNEQLHFGSQTALYCQEMGLQWLIEQWFAVN